MDPHTDRRRAYHRRVCLPSGDACRLCRGSSVALPLSPTPQASPRSAMKSIHLIALVLISSSISNALGTEAYTRDGPDPSSNWHRHGWESAVITAAVAASAVDSKGARHRSDGRPKGMVWLADLVQAFAPDYSIADRTQRREGSGIFHLALDLKTGRVREVTILKSTGHPTLDSCAIASMSKWRWKPGKWKEVDIPVFMSAFRWIPNTPINKTRPH